MTKVNYSQAVKKYFPFIEKLLLAAAVLGAVGGMGLLVLNVPQMIRFPYQWNYAESVVFAVVKNFPVEPLLYRDFDSPPFILNPYTPLYYWGCVFLSWFVGVDFLCGRLLTLLCSSGAWLCLFGIARRHITGFKGSFLFSAMFAVNPIAAGYWVEMRPDFMGLLFQVLGIFCLLEGEDIKPRRAAFRMAALLFLLLAFFAKQTYFVAAIAAAIWYFSKKEWRWGLVFGPGYWACVLSALIFFNEATSGNFWLNQQMTVKKKFILELFFNYWKEFLPAHGPVLLMAVAGLWTCLKEEKMRFFAIYFPLLLLWTLSLGKVGSSTNYFLELLACSALLACVACKNVLNPGQASGRRLGVLAVIAFQLLFFFSSMTHQYLQRRHDVTVGRQWLDRVTATLRKIRGDVLAENLSLLIAADKPVVYEPFEFSQMARAGLWDETKITDRIDRREFPLIVLNTNVSVVLQSGRFTANFIRHLKAHYQIAGASRSGYFFYRPNPS